MVMIKRSGSTRGVRGFGSMGSTNSARVNDLFKIICYLYENGESHKSNIGKFCFITGVYRINSSLLFLMKTGIIEKINNNVVLYDLTETFRLQWIEKNNISLI